MTKTQRTKTLFFTAGWCGPCKGVKRMLAKPENAELAGKIDVVDIDTAEGSKLADTFKVQAIPMFVSPDGEEHVGALTAKQLAKFHGGSR